MSLPLPDVTSCYFCEVIKNKADEWNVIEFDQLTVTLLNGRQFEEGQCLITPVRHAPTLLDLNEQEVIAVFTAARRLAHVLVKEFAPDGLLLYQNNGIGCGQEVPHFHLHVVPRRANSEWGSGPPRLALLEQETSARRFDHAEITDAKRLAVINIKGHFE